MVRFVEVKVYCSRCIQTGDRVQADLSVELPPFTYGGDPLVVDLCKPCRVDWWEPFMAEAVAIGIPAKDVTAAPKEIDGELIDKYVCPIHLFRYTEIGACRSHLKRHHWEFYISAKGMPWWPHGRQPTEDDRPEMALSHV
jgi:hypothetical protein